MCMYVVQRTFLPPCEAVTLRSLTRSLWQLWYGMVVPAIWYQWYRSMVSDSETPLERGQMLVMYVVWCIM